MTSPLRYIPLLIKDRYTLNTFMVRKVNGKKLEMLLVQHAFGTVYIAYHTTIYIYTPLHIHASASLSIFLNDVYIYKFSTKVCTEGAI